MAGTVAGDLTQIIDRVLSHITEEDVLSLATELVDIPSPTGSEGPVAEFLLRWYEEHGFEAIRQEVEPGRYNAVGRWRGASRGTSLSFNSHMDTTIHKDEWWTTRHAADPIFHKGWREGDELIGNGVCNCKGPMATWLLAAKAIKDSGISLKGDLLLMAVVGEIGVEPVDEFQPPQYLAKEAGTRYAITHGGVADYALVAEGTDFGIVGVEAGKAFFKITVFGDDAPIYTPYIPRPTPIETCPMLTERASTIHNARSDAEVSGAGTSLSSNVTEDPPRRARTVSVPAWVPPASPPRAAAPPRRPRARRPAAPGVSARSRSARSRRRTRRSPRPPRAAARWRS